ncbi:MAG: sugar transferase [Dehalococcoidia bacterium]
MTRIRKHSEMMPGPNRPEPIASPSLVLVAPSAHSGYDVLKRVLDILLAAILLLMLAPVMLAVALAIKLDSPGPIFFRQRRIGLRERPFTLVKFRSMHVDAEERAEAIRHLNITDGPTFKAKDDPRLTRVGKWLRQYSLDELPQLANVLRGEMSLVGPRPMLAQEVEAMSSAYRERFAVKPGLTCIWQVSGRSHIGFDDWMKLDLRYVRERSLWLDIVLLARTPLAVVTARGSY